jgi:uncharacterized protein YndB with AHSA1/START domain
MAINISRITINAASSEVWDALINPEKVKLWQYGSVLISDLKVGSEIRFRTEWEGQVFEQWGTVLEVQPNQTFKYNLFAPRPGLEDQLENYFEMAYQLTEQAGGTLLEIVQIDNRPGAKQEEEQGEENPILKMLKDLIEK